MNQPLQEKSFKSTQEWKTPRKKVNEGSDRGCPICASTGFRARYGDWELWLKCLSCGYEAVAYDG